MFENGRQRLTSWKEIASHLGRDVRTVLRWEKERGLPVKRVPGATGRVVFAYTDELDAWARGETPPPAAVPAPSVPPPMSPFQAPRWSVLLACVVFVLGFAAWRTYASRAAETGALTMRFTNDAMIALGPDRKERWRYDFPEGERLNIQRPEATPAEVVGGRDPGVLTASAMQFDASDGTVHGGKLLWFGIDGALRRTFTFTDRPKFGADSFPVSWAMTDFRIERSGARQVAVAAHHYQWWPSLVTLFDEQWNRRQTFVHAGWIERVKWVGPRGLLIAGFSNAYQGGMIALLDPSALNGQGPVPPGSAFDCTSCGPDRPIRYIVLPRTEVNRAGVEPFNRVVLDAATDRLVARTIEAPMTEASTAVDVLYEFTNGLDLVGARYSDRYWEAHRALEAEGKITHTREQCPDRDGPRSILMWEPKTGWRTIAIKH